MLCMRLRRQRMPLRGMFSDFRRHMTGSDGEKNLKITVNVPKDLNRNTVLS